MLARCPDCATVFRVAPADLRGARGLVRCGVCFAVFDAVEALEEGDGATPPVPAAGWKARPLDEAPAPVTDERHGVPGASPPEGAPAMTAAPITGRARGPFAEEAARGPVPAPTLAAHTVLLASERPGRRGGWVALAVCLTLVLTAQLAWFRGTQLLGVYPVLREPLAALCAYTGCRVPGARDPGAIQVRERDLRAHPRYRDAFLVRVILVNEAAFAQPYPILELRLYDTDGKVVAGRRFEPREYLAEDLDPNAPMPAGQPLHMLLELTGPKPLPASFELRFL